MWSYNIYSKLKNETHFFRINTILLFDLFMKNRVIGEKHDNNYL
jgi:hypothetical protein